MGIIQQPMDSVSVQPSNYLRSAYSALASVGRTLSNLVQRMDNTVGQVDTFIGQTIWRPVSLAHRALEETYTNQALTHIDTNVGNRVLNDFLVHESKATNQMTTSGHLDDYLDLTEVRPDQWHVHASKVLKREAGMDAYKDAVLTYFGDGKTVVAHEHEGEVFFYQPDENGVFHRIDDDKALERKADWYSIGLTAAIGVIGLAAGYAAFGNPKKVSAGASND